jgi:hypothetical protein
MNKLIIGLVLTISPLFLLGHNPLSAKYQVVAGEGATLLSISLSQTGLDLALSKAYSQEMLDTLEQKEYKELVIDYVKNNFDFSVNNESVILKKGGIKLGSHQTDLKFVLPPFPKEIEEFSIDIPAFKDNKYHQTIFSYNLFGMADKVILSNKNDYKSTVVLKEIPNYNNWIWGITAGLAALLMFIILFVLNRKKQ